MEPGTLLACTLGLAYGPFGAMLALYVAALALRAAGKPALLTWLIQRTRVPAGGDVTRTPADH